METVTKVAYYGKNLLQRREGLFKGIAAFLCFALFIFLSIPTSMEKNFNVQPHREECSPSKLPHTKTIHQIWLNYSGKPIPERFSEPMKGCRELNSDYKIIMWDDKAIEDFLKKFYPWIMDTYNRYSHDIMRVDAARFFLLYHYGGLYMDLDITCVMPYTKILEELSQYDVLMGRGFTFGVSNHLVIAKKHDRYMKELIDSFPAALKKFDHWYVLPYFRILFGAGASHVNEMYKSYTCKELVYVFPAEPDHNKYYINLHSGSWNTPDTLFISRVGQLHKDIHKVLSLKTFIAILVILFGCMVIYTYIKKRRGS